LLLLSAPTEQPSWRFRPDDLPPRPLPRFYSFLEKEKLAPTFWNFTFSLKFIKKAIFQAKMAEMREKIPLDVLKKGMQSTFPKTI